MGFIRTRRSRTRTVEPDGDRLLIALVNEARSPEELRSVLRRATPPRRRSFRLRRAR